MTERGGARRREGVVLRPARAFDAAPCAAIVNDWIDATPWVPRRRSPGAVARHFAQAVFPSHRVTVAEVGGEVAGFLALDREAAMIDSLYVATPGRGIGAMLVRQAQSEMAALSLWTFAGNRGARRFYARQGFCEGRRSDGDNNEALPDVEYLWTRAA